MSDVFNNQIQWGKRIRIRAKVVRQVMACVLVTGVAVNAVRGDELLLRDLTLLTGRLERYDPDAVQFVVENQSLSVDWGEIQSAKVGAEQAGFDRLFERIGDPLFRIDYRLQIGDERGLLIPAASLEEEYKERQSLTAYRVNLALLRGRLAVGQRSEVLLTYLRLLDLTKTLGEQTVETTPGRSLKFDTTTGLLQELLPVWEDPETAAKTLEQVESYLQNEAKSKNAILACRVYGASLALAADDKNAVVRLMTGLDDSTVAIKTLKGLMAMRAKIQIEGAIPVPLLEQSLAGFEPQMQALGRYWLGRAFLDNGNTEKGMLHLLHLPAVFHKVNPTLAAESLYRVMIALDTLGRIAEANVLSNELSNQFPSSRWAQQARPGANTRQ